MEPIGPPAAQPEARPDPVERAEILDAIRTGIADSLAVDPARIGLGTRLFQELKADSLDFLEMLFAVERRFGIQLKEKTLNRLLRTDFDEARLTEGGFLAADDLARLEEWLPALRAEPEKARITPRQVFGYVTVESLVMLVEHELAAGRAGA